MSRWLALAAEPEVNSTPYPLDHAKPCKSPELEENDDFSMVLDGCMGRVSKSGEAKVAGIGPCLVDALDAAEERAAIMEFDGGLTREEAEAKAIESHLPDITAAVGNGCSYPTVSFALLDRLIALGQLVKLADGSLRKGGAT